MIDSFDFLLIFVHLLNYYQLPGNKIIKMIIILFIEYDKKKSEVFGSLNQMVNFLWSKFCEPTIEYTDQYVVGTIF